mmetsp:Transcript_1949/g.1757  ORF Transcript_1949/g.1757 Transcript_1949/m.1757 type:complete len:133 (+) Transcript_1949:349-747(+)
MKYIHQCCLRGWIDSKKIVQSKTYIITYLWKAFECELCKESYDEALQTKYGLLQYENPFTDYMVLESINVNNSKNVYIIQINSEKIQFKIGRGHDNDIRISDISVSRFHASIKKEKDQFILYDNNSKFGTLA